MVGAFFVWWLLWGGVGEPGCHCDDAKDVASNPRHPARTSTPATPQVGPIDVSDGQGHEVITRYSSGLPTAAAWTTDSNCREYQKRQRNFRPQWPVHPSEAVSSNYYPVNCLIKTSSPAATFAVAVDRSEGGTSMNDGQLELMVRSRGVVIGWGGGGASRLVWARWGAGARHNAALWCLNYRYTASREPIPTPVPRAPARLLRCTAASSMTTAAASASR